MLDSNTGTGTQDENVENKNYPPITLKDRVTGEDKTTRFGDEGYEELLRNYNIWKAKWEEKQRLLKAGSSNTEEKVEIKEEKSSGNTGNTKVEKKQKTLGAKKMPRELTEAEWKRAKRRWIDIMDEDMLLLAMSEDGLKRRIKDMQSARGVGIRVQIVADILRISLEDTLKLIKKAEKKTKKSITFKNDKKCKLENDTGSELSKEQIKNEFNKKDGYISFSGTLIFIGWFLVEYSGK